MRRYLLSLACICLPVLSANGADLPASSAYWSGPYAGVSLSVGLSSARWRQPTGYIETYSALVKFPAHHRRSGLMAGVSLGYDLAVAPHWVLGAALDGDALRLNTLTNCASPSYTLGLICQSKPAATAALSARIGRVAGHSLIYLKGGLAYMNETLRLRAMNPDGYGATGAYNAITRNRIGAAYGIGLETRLGDGLTAKLEISQYRFGSQAFSSTDAGLGTEYGATVGQSLSFLKTGLSYRFNTADLPQISGAGSQVPDGGNILSDVSRALADFSDGLELEAGLRSGWAAGGYRYDLYASSDHSYRVSRLSWPGAGMMAESFFRLQHRSGLWLRASLGGILLQGGRKMHDQDFLEIYDEEDSDTISRTRAGQSYSVRADLGYDFYAGAWRFGPFAGFFRFVENQDAVGCTQLKNNEDICPANYVDNNAYILSRTSVWNALRLGASGGVRLTDHISLDGSVAWLPLIYIGGTTDNHWLRPSINPLISADKGHARGWQGQAVATYRLTGRLWLGLGLRYSHMRVHGEYLFTGYEDASPTRHFSDRAEAFAQISYCFGRTERRSSLFSGSL